MRGHGECEHRCPSTSTHTPEPNNSHEIFVASFGKCAKTYFPDVICRCQGTGNGDRGTSSYVTRRESANRPTRLLINRVLHPYIYPYTGECSDDSDHDSTDVGAVRICRLTMKLEGEDPAIKLVQHKITVAPSSLRNWAPVNGPPCYEIYKVKPALHMVDVLSQSRSEASPSHTNLLPLGSVLCS